MSVGNGNDTGTCTWTKSMGIWTQTSANCTAGHQCQPPITELPDTYIDDEGEIFVFSTDADGNRTLPDTPEVRKLLGDLSGTKIPASAPEEATVTIPCK